MEKIGVVGSGAREHVLAATLAKHSDVQTVYGYPGNPGFDDMIDKGVSTGVKDPDAIVSQARQDGIGFMAVGPESPLIDGIVDKLRANGILTLGPAASGAALEGSKLKTQRFNEDHDIPTPGGFEIFSPRQLLGFAIEHGFDSDVFKADGEAAGKGALVPNSWEEFVEAAHRFYNGDLVKAAASGILAQHRLPMTDPEVSDYELIDTEGNFMNLGSAQDHKRRLNNDEGPNTGGMGAYTNVPEEIFSQWHRQKSRMSTERFIEGIKSEGIDFDGFLFKGLMKPQSVESADRPHEFDKVDGTPPLFAPRVLEYNVRFGDPEAQVVLPRVGGYLLELLVSAAEGRLDKMSEPEVDELARVCIVMASENYPDDPITGREISGLDRDYGDDIEVYLAGVKKKDDRFITSGGRVLSIVGKGKTHKEAREKALAIAGKEDGINFEGEEHRTDIAHQAIEAA